MVRYQIAVKHNKIYIDIDIMAIVVDENDERVRSLDSAEDPSIYALRLVQVVAKCSVCLIQPPSCPSFQLTGSQPIKSLHSTWDYFTGSYSCSYCDLARFPASCLTL
jgi:hypothetical protein